MAFLYQSTPMPPTTQELDDDPGAAPDSLAGEAPSGSGFAHLVDRLQERPSAEPTRRRAPRPKPLEQPISTESPAQLLAKAKQMACSGQIEEAIGVCAALRAPLEIAGDPAMLGMLEDVLALSHQYAGRMRESMAAGYRAIEWHGKAADVPALVCILSLQAHSVAQSGDVVGAHELLERAVMLLPELRHLPRDECCFWNNAGAARYAAGNIEGSRQDLVRAVALLDQIDDPHLRVLSETNLLTIDLELAVARSADHDNTNLLAKIATFQAHIESLAEQGRHTLVAKCAEGVADALLSMGKLEEARDVLRGGVEATVIAKARPERGPLELRLARIERLQGQYRFASAHVALALELLAEGNLQEDLGKAHLENSLLHEAQQRWRSALDSYRKYSEMRDATLSARADARTQAVNMRIEVERERFETMLKQRDAL